MIIEQVEQGSEAWFKLRCGIPTASNFNQLITPKTMKPSSQATKYMHTLAGERITGAKAEGFQSQWMERGVAVEAEARAMFSMVMDLEIQEVGLVYQDERKLWAASPDGLLEKAGFEVKCPAMHTHVGYLLEGNLPGDYIPQVQGSMMITGLPCWWFMSYYPGLPPLIRCIERDDRFCATLKVLLEEFCSELDLVEKKLRELV